MSAGLNSRRSFLWGMAGSVILQWSGGMRALAQAKLDGPSVVKTIQNLKPGQYLWSPAIAPAGPVLLIVDLATQRADVYRNGVIIGVTTISSGKKGHETPTGIFTVLQKTHRPQIKYLRLGSDALHATIDVVRSGFTCR